MPEIFELKVSVTKQLKSSADNCITSEEKFKLNVCLIRRDGKLSKWCDRLLTFLLGRLGHVLLQ